MRRRSETRVEQPDRRKATKELAIRYMGGSKTTRPVRYAGQIVHEHRYLTAHGRATEDLAVLREIQQDFLRSLIVGVR